MQISNRLKKVASMVTEGNRIADVGTDHGYVPVWLLLQGKIKSAIGMDIRPGPLERADSHRKQYHLEDLLELRLSDGLKEYRRGEADTVVIAGMGGELMIRILQEGMDKLGEISELVLSPQSEIRRVREFLAANGFAIVRESLIKEEGKFYVVMKAVHGECDYTEAFEFQYGKRLLEEGGEDAAEYLEREMSICRALCDTVTGDSERQMLRRRDLEQKTILIKQAQSCLQKKQNRL